MSQILSQVGDDSSGDEDDHPGMQCLHLHS